MIMETAKTRMDLTQTMWEEFQKRAPLPVGMYNTLLQVYQQNSHKFDPAQFLEGMEQDGVLPNQVSLQYKSEEGVWFICMLVVCVCVFSPLPGHTGGHAGLLL
jgi:hypothetical protein